MKLNKINLNQIKIHLIFSVLSINKWDVAKYFSMLFRFLHTFLKIYLTKQKINKETQTLNDTMDQLDLIDIYRTCHPKTINFTVFSSAHGTFSWIDHILGHKSSLGKFKKIEIIPVIFSDHSAVRLDLNYRKKNIKNSNIWRLNNTLLNNQQIIEEIKKKSESVVFIYLVDFWITLNFDY